MPTGVRPRARILDSTALAADPLSRPPRGDVDNIIRDYIASAGRHYFLASTSRARHPLVLRSPRRRGVRSPPLLQGYGRSIGSAHQARATHRRHSAPRCDRRPLRRRPTQAQRDRALGLADHRSIALWPPTRRSRTTRPGQRLVHFDRRPTTRTSTLCRTVRAGATGLVSPWDPRKRKDFVALQLAPQDERALDDAGSRWRPARSPRWSPALAVSKRRPARAKCPPNPHRADRDRYERQVVTRPPSGAQRRHDATDARNVKFLTLSSLGFILE